jgi:S1-C subfamily serine protease/antitoxin component YwqK of YwqJK toxin-antitoxin module
MEKIYISNNSRKKMQQWLRSILLVLICLFAFRGEAQTKKYFDKGGKASEADNSYYFRESGAEPFSFKSFYTNGGALFFEGKISAASETDENLNVYLDQCTWYYKNGNKRMVRTFNKTGQETGTSSYFYESGKIWKEIEFTEGKAKTTYKEFDEDGRSSRIFEENFSDNSNDWDLYTSDKTSALIQFGHLEISSYAPEGASRYISHPLGTGDFVIEAIINTIKLKDGEKAGLLYGFKDWQNYNFFFITNSSFYLGTVYEGISSMRAEGLYSASIIKNGDNKLTILSNGEKNVYSINGNIEFSFDRPRNPGTNIGFAVSGKGHIQANRLIVKEVKSSGTVSRSESDRDVKATGSGLILSSSGYVLTNYHVVKDAGKIILQVNIGGEVKSYNATVVQKDVDNDLAILQIKDENFKSFDAMKYAFRENGGVEVGAGVFTIGYPYALSGMGIEAKFNDGKISSKTGYNDAINTYQTSVPLQPGNSGGPLFDDKGELIGVVNSKLSHGDNVSYAIKLNYIKNLIELLPEAIELPKDHSLTALPLEEKLKILSAYVTLIKIK